MGLWYCRQILNCLSHQNKELQLNDHLSAEKALSISMQKKCLTKFNNPFYEIHKSLFYVEDKTLSKLGM